MTISRDDPVHGWAPVRDTNAGNAEQLTGGKAAARFVQPGLGNPDRIVATMLGLECPGVCQPGAGQSILPTRVGVLIRGASGAGNAGLQPSCGSHKKGHRCEVA